MARTNGTDVVLMIYNMLCNLDSYIGKVLAVHVFIFYVFLLSCWCSDSLLSM